MSVKKTGTTADWIKLRTCVSPNGRFVFGLHKPHFRARNLRLNDYVLSLGETRGGRAQLNLLNFPPDDVDVPATHAVYEVANPFPFRGVTYIGKAWADGVAPDPTRISIASPAKVSMGQAARKALGISGQSLAGLFAHLPDPLKLALATTSTDPRDLELLAENSCQFIYDPAQRPAERFGLRPRFEWPHETENFQYASV